MNIDREIRREIRLIATQTYIHEVKERSGLETIGKLQKKLLKKSTQSNAEYWEENSRVLYKYARGSRVIKNEHLINKIESHWPGTKSILNHPFWFILENPFSDQITIDNQLRLLNQDVQARVFKLDKSTNSYIRRESYNEKALAYISKENNLDALACLLMLVREMDIKQHWYVCTRIKFFANAILLRLLHCTSLAVRSNNLLDIVYKQIIGRVNPLMKEQKLYHYGMEKWLAPPKLVDSAMVLHYVIPEIISFAREYQLIDPEKNSELNFLYWADRFNLAKTHHSLETYHNSPDSQQFIHELLQISRST